MKVIPTQEHRPFCALARRFRGYVLAAALAIIPAFAVQAADVADCSEEALQEAIDTDGNATFTEDCEITLTGPLLISGDVTIDAQGHNVTINGNQQSQLFELSAVNLNLYGLKLINGQDTNGLGGVLSIDEGSTVVFSNCTLSGNISFGTNGTNGANGPDSISGNGGNGKNGTPGGEAFGGAIYNLGSLTLLYCNVSSNSATAGDGGNGGNGGSGASGPHNAGNGGAGAAGASAGGGAIYHLGSELIISNSTFSGNSVFGGFGGTGGARGTNGLAGLPGAGGLGGKAFGAAICGSNDVTVINSTFSENTAQGGTSAAAGTLESGNGRDGLKGGDAFGAGIFAAGDSVTAFITNCTFYRNDVIGGTGGDGGNAVEPTHHNAGKGGNGGIATGGGFVTFSEAYMISCTFSNCNAFGGTNGLPGTGLAPVNGSKGASRGGNIANVAGLLHLANTILATNLSGGAGYGAISDEGYNITFGNTIALTEATSFKTNDAKLGALLNNGGPTTTMALASNSPAIDRIPADALHYIGFDQRGIPRPINAGADIGAYELATAGPVIIVQQPTNTPASATSNATFRVTAGGSAPFTYRWRLNGTNIAGATSSSYTVTNARPANAGPYTVAVSNSYLGTNYSVISTQVYVLFSPLITSQPTDQTVTFGHDAVFQVSATGDAPLTYQWRFEEEEIIGATNTSLTITNSQTEDIGQYDVIVSNNSGSVTSAPASLNIFATILTNPASQTVSPGGTASFSVSAAGSPPLAYQWRHNGSTIPGATGSSKLISGAQSSDAGTYDVIVTNLFNSVTSAPATLTVGQFPISNARASNNAFLFSFPTESGKTYVVETKTNLNSAWSPLVTNSGNGSTMTITNSMSNSPARFFRVRVQ